MHVNACDELCFVKWAWLTLVIDLLVTFLLLLKACEGIYDSDVKQPLLSDIAVVRHVFPVCECM